jgi:hypothetical protein
VAREQNYVDATPHKKHYRRMPLNVVQHEAAMLWDAAHKKLRCDWLELAGHGAPSCQMLIDQGALGDCDKQPKNPCFIGLDTEEDGGKVIQGCQTLYDPWCQTGQAKFLRKNMFDCIEESFFGNSDLAKVGVVVYDTNQSIGIGDLNDPDWALGKGIRSLIRFARYQQSQLGEFVMVINVTQQHASHENRAQWEPWLAQQLADAHVIFPEDVERVRANPGSLVQKYPCTTADFMLFSLIRFGMGEVLGLLPDPVA